jgi:hypothetical protein
MRVWDMVRGWVDQNAARYVYARVPAERTDAPAAEDPMVPYASYLRLWLNEMYLSKSTAWGKAWFPAVHAEVQLAFGDQCPVTFARVVDPPGQQTGGVQLNERLTELLPFNGGVVEVEAALLALPGRDYLATAVGVLKEFSALVVPPLGQALAVAAKISTGTRDLLGASQGGVHLGFHQAFASEGGGGGNVLRPGYHAVVLATPAQVDPDRLWVLGDRLHYAADGRQAPAPLQGHDYLLLRVEGRSERDDWRLRDIDEPMREAIMALSQGDATRAAAYRTVALAAAWRSPDLAVRDRRRVVAAVKEELAAVEEAGFGAVGTGLRSLDEVMSARAMPPARAAALGELSAQEVFSA